MGDLVLLVPKAQVQSSMSSAKPSAMREVVLEEMWSPAKRYICAESYPEGAMMAVRAAPTRESKQLMTIGACKEYFVTGRVGDFLQINVEIDGVPTPGYVPHVIGDRVLLVPAPVELQQQQQQSAAPAAA